MSSIGNYHLANKQQTSILSICLKESIPSSLNWPSSSRQLEEARLTHVARGLGGSHPRVRERERGNVKSGGVM